MRGFGGRKLITGRKHHILVDSLGLILTVVVTAALAQDQDGIRLLLSRLGGFCKKLCLIWVDGAYRDRLLNWVTQNFACRLHPVLRLQAQQDFAVLARRWVVERTFAWLELHCRHARDYERLPVSSEAFIYIAIIRIMLRRLARI